MASTPSPTTSLMDAAPLAAAVNKKKQRSYSMDDSKVDYTSLLGLEDRRRRFSEDVVDIDTKNSVMLQKLYRQIQRQVHCDQDSEASMQLGEC